MFLHWKRTDILSYFHSVFPGSKQCQAHLVSPLCSVLLHRMKGVLQYHRYHRMALAMARFKVILIGLASEFVFVGADNLEHTFIPELARWRISPTESLTDFRNQFFHIRQKFLQKGINCTGIMIFFVGNDCEALKVHINHPKVQAYNRQSREI